MPLATELRLPEVADAVRKLLMPLLEVQALAALACTSKGLKETVYHAPASVWGAAARQVLPEAHPIEEPITLYSIQAALQSYNTAVSNIKSGTALHKQVHHASKASMNARGSHLAVVQREAVKIFEMGSMQCVTSYEGLPDQVRDVQWGPCGTEGAILTWQQEVVLTVYQGDLVQPMHCTSPWKSLECTILDCMDENEECKITQFSPDLLKLCMVSVFETACDPLQMFGQPQTVVVTVFETASGFSIKQHVLDYASDLTCKGMVWHADSETYFYGVHNDLVRIDTMFDAKGEVWAVMLNDGRMESFDLVPGQSWYAKDLKLSADGTALAASVCIDADDLLTPVYIVMGWPSCIMLGRLQDLFLGVVIWQWSGSTFCCLQKAEGQVHKSALCIGTFKPTMQNWLPSTTCHLDNLLPHEAWSRCQSETFKGDLCMSFSPSGQFLAFNYWHFWAPEADQESIFIVDAMHPELPIVSQFRLAKGFTTRCLKWAVNSALLFATGQLWAWPIEMCLGNSSQLLDFSSSA